MINARGWILVALVTLAWVTIASANADAQPDKPAWAIRCAVVRKLVADHGEEAAAALARAHGVPEHVIRRAKACLK